jgi:methylated-DNA-[protein]-cysteine S-methyltransferase
LLSFEFNGINNLSVFNIAFSSKGTLRLTGIFLNRLKCYPLVMIAYTTIESPVGPLLLAGDERGLLRVSFGAMSVGGGKREKFPKDGWTEDAAPFGETIRQLRAYFSGRLQTFDVPLALIGTEFQVRVWQTLRSIPYGETISYLELAKRIGNAKAVRAVGLANGANPIPIIVPCHRVIGSNGSLTGFGGGLENKAKLLALESKQLGLQWKSARAGM